MDSPQGAPIDRYVVLEYLAEGGMGAIYLGKKLGAGGFEKQVVLKQLLPEFTRQQEFIDLFLREARLSATLDHANIIHTIDLVTAGEEHFIVMEYLDGADLRTLLKKSKQRGHRISAAAGIYVAKELLSALSYAHNKFGPDDKPLGLIHRDISPSNILISGNGEVKLTDFGIAKAATHNSIFYRVKGKVGYMSPEQARSESMDARSDLYSLAVCLYEIITGERLLVAAGITTSADELYSKAVPLMSQRIRGLPPELDKVMLRALSIDPDHRYQTAAEFQEALLRCAHKHGLMMSAPELATYLADICGSHSTWRNEGDDTHDSGTELYQQEEGTEQISGLSGGGYHLDSIVAIDDGYVNPHDNRRERAKTSLSHLIDLKGVELTSMAKLGVDDGAGAQPLVNLGGVSPPGIAAPGIPGAPASFGSPAGSPHGSTLGAPAPSPGFGVRGNMAHSDEYSGVVLVQGTGKRDSTGEVSRPYNSAGENQVPGGRAAKASSKKTWLLASLILLLGLGIAAAIGLTGPSISSYAPSGNEFSKP